MTVILTVSLEMANAKSQTTSQESALGFRVWRLDSVPVMPVAHTHPDIELNWSATRRLEYHLAGRRAVIEVGELGLFWGGIPHQLLETGERVDGVWLTVPLVWFLHCGLPAAFAARVMSGQLVTVALERVRLEQWADDFAAGAARQRLLLLELEAILGRVALGGSPALGAHGSPAHTARRPRPLRGGHVEQIMAHIAAHYRDPLTAQSIAEGVGLHPKYLMTVFRQGCGLTVGDYVLRLRLAHAQRLLVTTRLSILDVALESGFGSLSRFYEAFAQHADETPTQYRRRHSGTGEASRRDQHRLS
jgi:AraC family transcriptional regulator, melibiose operon regulatory protein